MHINLISTSKSSFLKFSTLIILGLLGACATTDQQYGDTVVVSEREIKSEPIDAGNDDQYEGDTTTPIQDSNISAQRAQQYSQQVGQGSVSSSIDAALNAAEHYIQANDGINAQRQLEVIDVPLMSQQQTNRYQIVAAYISYTQQNPQQALIQLRQFLNGPQSQSIDARTQRVDALLLSSLCHQKLGNAEAAITTLIERESYLSGAAKAETSRYIWQVIESIPTTERASIIANTENIELRRRLEQSQHGQIAATNQSLSQFNQWQQTENAPDNVSLIDSLWTNSSPRTIAILLPSTSRFAKAAQAVTDGIRYQHGQNSSGFTPQLNFYDIGENPAMIGQFYNAAIQQGADFIIGPLGKSYADQLNAQYGANFPVTTLLLGGELPLNSNAFRLSMSPERESFDVANRAAARGFVNAAVLAPNTPAGKRGVDAFQKSWLAKGGRVSNIINYSPNQFDHSSELKMLFNINQSQQRYHQLSKTLGFKPKFSAYRRKDIDFVYMVADDKTGRLVRPQINFFGGTTIPVYAPSSVYNGVQDVTNNRDLDRTAFPIMPWVLAASEYSPYAGTLNKLFAIGADSYQLAAALNQLRRSSDLAVAGNTGTLTVKHSGEVFYQPVWAYFKNGEAISDVSSQALQDATQIDLERLHERSKRILNRDHSNSKSYDDSNWNRRESRRK